ncbi:hypothetical protein F2Q68_00037500 [Brassica cretica]|uniref:Yippee domain-containing protein n=1 Tax=Brassica cretica TaxID=69181 RepID=A0A8S9HDF3_BRACR|nr:hypothetical protein F2Q68_00037500 [Brassica cretica]
MSDEKASSKKKESLGWMEWVRGWSSVFGEILFQRITASHLLNPLPPNLRFLHANNLLTVLLILYFLQTLEFGELTDSRKVRTCLIYLEQLTNALKVFEKMAQSIGPRLYSCCNCRNHVGLHDDIISKAFQGRTGKAFLFSHAMNVVLGAKEDRNLLTGLHTVADISCADCNEPLGWKYERAYEASQKYKEGKFIFEKAKIVKEEDW